MDTQLSYHMVPLVFQKRNIIQCRMPPDSVIEDLYIFKDALSCNGSRCIGMTQFCFQGGDERFCHGIVVAVPRSAHALGDTILGEMVSEQVACILTSPIRMEYQRSPWLSSPYCACEGMDNQIVGKPLIH